MLVYLTDFQNSLSHSGMGSCFIFIENDDAVSESEDSMEC